MLRPTSATDPAVRATHGRCSPAATLPPRPVADETTRGGPSPAQPDPQVVLKPLSRPELGEIRLDGTVLAVGRHEAPFASFPREILMMLSRRHARIFRENGAVHVADLDSRNGTTINRIALQGGQASTLKHGDELGFGGVLAYRVQIDAQSRVPREAPLSLTLTPTAPDSALQPIVIARFPFLVSKKDARLAQGRAADALQFDYLSRRHAHIFQKGNQAFIEDLGSTNGTFIDGQRLDERAMPLRDGALLAFGGDHYVYRVTVHGTAGATAPARAATDITRPYPPGTPSSEAPAVVVAATAQALPPEMAPQTAPQLNPGKTTFVAAPDSFLEIFCADTQDSGDQASADATTPPAPGLPQPTPKAARRGRVASFLAELASVWSNGGQDRLRTSLWRGATLLAAVGGAMVTLALWTTTQGELKGLLERGEVAQAARVADEALRRSPDDAEIRALATEAALKNHVPAWLARIAERDFQGARAETDALNTLGVRNPELPPFADELAWLGNLKQLVHERGGPDRPIRIYADEDRIAAMLARWNRANAEHQRTLSRLATVVPAFDAPYAEALTHLRRLQSEASVHLAAIDRLKAAVDAELGRDRPEALVSVLSETAARYPALGGIDELSQDLQRYLQLRRARARQDRVFAQMAQARFTTPPFQQALLALATSGQLPPEAIVRDYLAATEAWKRGQTDVAQAALQRLATGPWAPSLAREVERRRGVLEQFAALESARGKPGHVERLLGFRDLLADDDDVHFRRATDTDLATQKAPILARADQLLGQARALWQDYRASGAIEAAQRIEITASADFRKRARLLADAHRAAGDGLRLRSLAGADAGGWAAISDEIAAEMTIQRNALRDLRNVLEPQLLNAKLAMLGEPNE